MQERGYLDNLVGSQVTGCLEGECKDVSPSVRSEVGVRLYYGVNGLREDR